VLAGSDLRSGSVLRRRRSAKRDTKLPARCPQFRARERALVRCTLETPDSRGDHAEFDLTDSPLLSTRDDGSSEHAFVYAAPTLSMALCIHSGGLQVRDMRPRSAQVYRVLRSVTAARFLARNADAAFRGSLCSAAFRPRPRDLDLAGYASPPRKRWCRAGRRRELRVGPFFACRSVEASESRKFARGSS